MEKKRFLLAVLLLLTVCVWAEEPKKYSLMLSPSNPMVNGSIDIPDQQAAVGSRVTVTCKPDQGYGLSRGVYYAPRNANGGLSESHLADNTSHDPDDRANESQTFSFTMPAADVEVWAYFVPLRELRIHQSKNAKSKLVPTYTSKEVKNDYTVVKNIPKKPVYLKIEPETGYELVDVEKTNIAPGYYERMNDSIIKIFMPTEDVIMHVTPIFGQNHYEVKLPNEMEHIQATVTNLKPKAREEVDLILVTDDDYIPARVTITGCKQSWMAGKPERLKDGKWKTVYRFKVDFQNVDITYGVDQVHDFIVTDTQNSKRVKTYIPEMIPGYAGVARSGQQIPMVFMMPESFSVNYNTQGASETPLVYHNALKNSFADQGMDGWHDTTVDDGKRLPVMVFTDSVGNKYWRTSGVNSMSQTVDLTKFSFPPSAKQNGRLNVAAIASINPCNARSAKVSIEATGNGNTETLVVADPSGKEKDWITELKVGTVSATATEMKLQVEATADDENKRSYEGPMFDDLCLLLPTDGQSIKNEDVLIFKMGDNDITIDYTPSGSEGTVSVVKTDHANLTLLNTATGEEGESVKAMTDDVILITGKADDGYAVYELSCAAPDEESNARASHRAYVAWDDDEPEILEPDSVNVAANKTFFHYVKSDDDDIAITPTVDKQQVMLENYYGGKIAVDNESAKKGETVVVTVTPKAGCQLKQIRTIPANAAQFTEVQVDKNTGAGTYSFVMPGAYITLKGEFIVPITTAQQVDSISNQCGTFRLDNDLDLGNLWDNKKITLIGDFDGNGHRITYGGNTSLFQTVSPKGSVRHLYVNANVKGIVIGEASDDYMGGICMKNNGVIEDCVVSGSVKNERPASFVGGVAGLNGANKKGGTIAYCHVLCDGLEAAGTSFGVARQEKHAVIRDNVFSGMFVSGDRLSYMICNDQDSVTIERNYYVPSAGNSRAVLCKGVSAATSAILADALKNVPKTCYVFTASIKSKYIGGNDIKFAETTNVTVERLSTETANAGTVVTASVSVSGNNHLESITIAAPDGSDAFQCPFTDNTENVYTFSFTMPAHEVLITPQVKEGRFIYTATQFEKINDREGIFYLARDIDLNNWGKNRAISLKGTFHGGGHTIRYHEEGTSLGLFSRIREGALLEGLRVVGIVESSENCAGIAYENWGTIRDCHFCGQITRLEGNRPRKNRIAALVYSNAGSSSLVDHCSATGILSNSANQTVVNNCPLYAVSDKAKMKDCVWIGAALTAEQYQQLLQSAQAMLNDYPVCAQGILDRIDARVITGSHSQTVPYGQTLAELTITDGEPFVCTSDVQVNRVVYKRKATKNLEEWVLPFAFTQIAGDGQFTYHEAVENNNMPDIGSAHPLTLSNTPQSVNYTFNQPWLVSNGEDGEERTYVLSNADGSPITIKATNDHRVARYKSIMDIGSFFAAYDTIPAKTVSDELMYAWNGTQQEFVLSNGSTSILPNRFYLQFYNTTSKKFVKYSQTQWAKMENATPSTQAKASRRLAAAVADGWQPIFLDPRQPQSITARMLDYYDVAYLADIRGEVLDEEDDEPLSVVSLVYIMADDRMDLPAALPLLVRAKRSDAEPLVDAKTGAELEELLMKMMEEEDETDEGYDEGYDEDYDDEDALDIPHYWCASFDNRLDIWQLPAPERYADLAEYGCMMFNDNSYDQSFVYATANDTRSTSPMSYCITLLNAKTYELLPLLGDRVCVEFLVPAETTGVNDATRLNDKGQMINDKVIYNLSGQRVSKPTKGLYIVNGRKMIKK